MMSITVRLDLAANDNASIIKAAVQGFKRIFQPGFSYLKCGVTVMDFVPVSYTHLDVYKRQVSTVCGDRKSLSLISRVEYSKAIRRSISISLGESSGFSCVSCCMALANFVERDCCTYCPPSITLMMACLLYTSRCV